MKIVYYPVIFLLVYFACSCSSMNMVTPQKEISTSPSTDLSALPVFVSDTDSSGQITGGMGILGLFSGHVETANLSGEITPVRLSGSTDTLEVVDITNFLQLAPCTNCVDLASISRDIDGHPVLTIGIKHPFAVGDPLKPISGRNRADLHVFNVEGIVVMETSSEHDFPAFGKSVAIGTRLINADGYTDYLDDSLDTLFATTADLHPYKQHFRDYTQGNFDALNPMGFESVTTPPPSGNLVMAMGCDFDHRDYVFDIPSGESFEFIFAVGCTYAVSANTKTQRFNPEFRIPQHNKKAASEVSVEISSNNLLPGDTSSTAELTVRILDINHGVAVGSALNEMAFDSSVGDILVDVPGITSNAQSDYVFNGGDGRDPSNPLNFTATVTNTAGGNSGTYYGLVKVLDSYPTSQNSSPLLNGLDGIKRVDPLINPLEGLFEIEEFATYAFFEIDISSEPQDPVAIIVTTPSPPNVTNQYPTVLFDGSTSYDPDGGSITLFEWDFDWDQNPSNFTPDIIGMYPQVEHNYQCEGGIYTAALRVTDDDTPAGVSLIASVRVDVTDNFVPGVWDGSMLLGNQDIAGDTTYHTGQMLSVDSTNLVHIITYTNSAIYHRTFDGTTLSTAETIPGTPASLRMVTSETDGNDELHVVWLNGYGAGMTVQHTVTVNGSFTGIIDNLAVAGVDNPYFESMNIRRNVNGHVMITWLAHDIDFEPYCYFEYTLDTGSGFSPAAQVPHRVYYGWGGGASSMRSVNLVATPDGHFHQIDRWRESGTSFLVAIFDLIYDGSVWQAPRTAYSNPLTSSAFTDLTACAGLDGDIHLTGRNPGDNDTYYIRYDADSDTWLPPFKMSATTNPWPYGHMGAIEVSPSGYVHSVFVSETDDLLHLKIFCQFWDAATILATPDVVIDSTLTDQTYGHADIAWDNDGNLLAIYRTNSVSPYQTAFNRLVY